MNMRYLALLCLVAVSASNDYYDSDIDNVDIEGIVRCPAKMKRFTGCFIDRNECDELSAKVKGILADAITTHCKKCSPKQRHATKRYFETLKYYPEDYELIKNKYDPSGKNIEATLEALQCD